MGSYTTITTIFTLMPQLPRQGSTVYSQTSEIVSQAITDAEAEINGYVAGRYSLPFSSVPVQIGAIADALSCFYTYLYVYSADNINRNDFSNSESAKYEIQVKKLEAISDGKITLTLANGSVVEQASSTSLVTSVQKAYTPMFDMDTSTAWGIDPDRSDSIADDRS